MTGVFRRSPWSAPAMADCGAERVAAKVEIAGDVAMAYHARTGAMAGDTNTNSQRSVPEPVLNRIPLYLRFVEGLRDQGVGTISSRKLAQALGLTDGQVRADLVYFGAFGRPGVGYHVERLVDELRQIVGTDRIQRVALVGYGSIGRALVMYEGFARRAFDIVAIFDRAPEKIGQLAGRLIVQDVAVMIEELRRLAVRLAILAVPAEATLPLAQKLIEAGVTGIMNFAPVALKPADHVVVTNVDLMLTLERLLLRMRIADRQSGQ